MFSQSKNIVEAYIPKGDIMPCAIEQFPAKEFFHNECGWLRNDIAALAATTSKAQYDAIVQRLVENKATYNIKPDTKLEDAFKAIVPRWCQSPNELASFAEYAAGLTFADLDEAYKDMRPKDAPEDASVDAQKAE